MRYGAWVVMVGLMVAASRAGAQPQGDAYLADDSRQSIHEEDEPGRAGGTVSRPKVARESDEPTEPALSTDQLRDIAPDVELRAVPGSGLGIYVGSVYPFQALSLGVLADVYFGDYLRVSGMGTLGLTPTWNNHNTGSLFGQVEVGVTLHRWLSQTVVDLDLPAFGRTGPGAQVLKRPALVPSSQGLELEVGLFNGYLALYRCTANCSDLDPGNRVMDDQSGGFTYFFVGARYDYYRFASSETGRFRNLQRGFVAFDLITRPTRIPPEGLQDAEGTHVSYQDFGGRLKVGLPAVRPAAWPRTLTADLEIGYLPVPAEVSLAFRIVVL